MTGGGEYFHETFVRHRIFMIDEKKHIILMENGRYPACMQISKIANTLPVFGIYAMGNFKFFHQSWLQG
jgi:hypothetical protein